MIPGGYVRPQIPHLANYGVCDWLSIFGRHLPIDGEYFSLSIAKTVEPPYAPSNRLAEFWGFTRSIHCEVYSRLFLVCGRPRTKIGAELGIQARSRPDCKVFARHTG